MKYQNKNIYQQIQKITVSFKKKNFINSLITFTFIYFADFFLSKATYKWGQEKQCKFIN